jgi:hypothetical protein
MKLKIANYNLKKEIENLQNNFKSLIDYTSILEYVLILLLWRIPPSILYEFSFYNDISLSRIELNNTIYSPENPNKNSKKIIENNTLRILQHKNNLNKNKFVHFDIFSFFFKMVMSPKVDLEICSEIVKNIPNNYSKNIKLPVCSSFNLKELNDNKIKTRDYLINLFKYIRGEINTKKFNILINEINLKTETDVEHKENIDSDETASKIKITKETQTETVVEYTKETTIIPTPNLQRKNKTPFNYTSNLTIKDIRSDILPLGIIIPK